MKKQFKVFRYPDPTPTPYLSEYPDVAALGPWLWGRANGDAWSVDEAVALDVFSKCDPDKPTIIVAEHLASGAAPLSGVSALDQTLETRRRSAAVNLLVATAKRFIKTVGVYGITPPSESSWCIVNEAWSKDKVDKARWKSRSKEIQSQLSIGLDWICPDLYVRYNEPNMLRRSMRAMLMESKRLARASGGVVVPFIWHEWWRGINITPEMTGNPLPIDVWKMVLDECSRAEVYGVIVYQQSRKVNDSIVDQELFDILKEYSNVVP